MPASIPDCAAQEKRDPVAGCESGGGSAYYGAWRGDTLVFHGAFRIIADKTCYS